MRKQEILGGIALTFLLILLTETLPRLFFKVLNFPHPNEFIIKDQELGWKLKPNYHKKWITINALGFRGKEITQKKGPHTFRIVALGESSTFGYDDDPSSPYPVQLEKILEKKKDKACPFTFEVINGGIEKYFSWQIAKKMEKEIIPLQPDVVFVYMGWNDLYVHDPATGKKANPESLYNRAIKKSLTLRFLTVAIYRYLLPPFERVSENRKKSMRAFYPASLIKNYKKIVTLARKNKIKILLATLPSLLGSEDLEKAKKKLHFPFFTHNITLLTLLWQAYNQAIASFARQEKVPLLPLDKIFSQKNRSAFFLDTLHVNKEGNALIAMEIFKKLNKQKSLPCTFH